MESVKSNKKGIIEKIGARLPESNILFLILIAVVLVASFFFSGVYSDLAGTEYQVVNMLSTDGIRWIIYNIMNNFRNYPPLAIVIVGVIGFGFAEKVGLLGALIKKVGISTPDYLILPVIIFLGINSSIASDAGYIVLVPLAGALYAGLGRNPLIGIAASFAAVSAGFGAALIPTPGDALLGGITMEIVKGMGPATPNIAKNLALNAVTMNYIFMIGSTFFLTIFLTFVTKKFVEKRCEHHEFTVPSDRAVEITELDPKETAGLKAALYTLIVTLAIIFVGYFTGILSSYDVPIVDAEGVVTGVKTYKPILENIIVFMIIIFLFPSIAYGRVTKKITDSKEYVNLTVSAMRDMAYIMVFAIFAGNFLAIFAHSGLDKYIANNGANFLISLKIDNAYVLIIAFMLIAAGINLFMGSASAKWTLLAPIFIPMMINASNGDLSADQIQAAYRIADSSTNVITPLMTYMGIILITAKHYIPKFELGDLIAVMMPYSMSILFGWGLFYIVWLFLGLPFGI